MRARFWCQQPLTHTVRALTRSLYYNSIGAEGAMHLAEGLKENKALTSLKYATERSKKTVSSH